MAILEPSDFTNNPTYNIALSKTAEKELPALIDQVERDNLQELLGCELHDLFIADLTVNTPQIPQTQIYIDIFNAFCEDETHCGLQRSFGIRDMLMSIVYFEWHRYNATKSIAPGMVAINPENSSVVGPNSYGAYQKYNRGVQSYNAIQWLVYDNTTDYPTFNGIRRNYISEL